MLCYVCMFCFLYNDKRDFRIFGSDRSSSKYELLCQSSSFQLFFKALNLPLDNTTLSLHHHIALSVPEICCLVVVQRFILRKLPPFFARNQNFPTKLDKMSGHHSFKKSMTKISIVAFPKHRVGVYNTQICALLKVHVE